jgi:hypothetical protein
MRSLKMYGNSIPYNSLKIGLVYDLTFPNRLSSKKFTFIFNGYSVLASGDIYVNHIGNIVIDDDYDDIISYDYETILIVIRPNGLTDENESFIFTRTKINLASKFCNYVNN